MGGRAIKEAYTRRYNKDEFLELKDEVTSELEKYFKRVAVPYYYNNKETFGDLDVLVTNDEVNILDVPGIIETLFGYNELYHNNNCVSFDHKEFQIDVILVSEEYFDTAFMYLSYNDLGNLLGVIAKGFGVKYGDMGLTKDIWYKGQKIYKNLVISKDPERIFPFLGVSYERWKEGFDDIEDIFEFVYSSPYFNKEGYKFENLNKINRDRNYKRDVYMYFLEWIEKKPNKNYEFNENKETYLKRIEEYFPESDVTERIRGLEYQQARKLYISSKVNTKTLLDRYGLESKEYGKFMSIVFSKLKGSFSNEKEYEDFMVDSDKETILKEMDRFKEETFDELGFN